MAVLYLTNSGNFRMYSSLNISFALTMDVVLCWEWTTIRLFFCPPPFQPSQRWVQIVVVMLFCSMLEINNVVLQRWVYTSDVVKRRIRRHTMSRFAALAGAFRSATARASVVVKSINHRAYKAWQRLSDFQDTV